MAPSMGGGFGLARSNAQIWSGGDLMVSANRWTSAPTNSTSSSVLAAPGEGKYVKVWGVYIASHVEVGTLLEVTDSGSSGEMVIGAVASRNTNTQITLPVPIKLTANTGLEANWISVASGAKIMLNVFYSIHDE